MASRRQLAPQQPDPAHERKREQILQAAEELFFRKGYSGTTIADICERLGVTKPFLYYYFANKNEIFETLSWRASHACLTALHFENDERPAIERLREGLHRFAAANIHFFKSGTFAYREAGALQPAFTRRLKAMARRFYDELCALLEQARADGELDFHDARLTGLAIGSIAGFMYTWYKPDGRLPPHEMVQELTGILLRIAGAETAPRAKTRKARSTGSKTTKRRQQ
ncbi:TetR family transcriptional regulator [Noviherbaspirillum aridicola]|uniref:TetR family transcriptional regulator n=2 Tax=Noviherbaspirillum aridicola TaxID=2849687 RepID=A0ABQ4PYS5_9BURK|nr:TetR family transcriptional regulator [Noviherbaspirillum aridicola]